MEKKEKLFKEIEQLKKDNNAVILAHVYQNEAVQDIADFTGDSLELSKKAVETDAEIIVFCGVIFMAETAHILNPEKKVLLPDLSASCELADTATIDHLKSKKREYPEATVVSYINSSAQIKAASDICCTSANAVKIVESIPNDTILFLPDKNLAAYVAEQTNKHIIPWDGYCYVHENIKIDTIQKLKTMYPNAEIVVHPECNTSVRHAADYIGGTSGMATYIAQSPSKEFIVGTEDNFVHRMKKNNHEKLFHPVGTQCTGMRRITLEKVKIALEQMKYEIILPEHVRIDAKKALNKMMKVS